MAGLPDEIYLRSPIWLQQIAVTTWGAGWYRRRFGARFRRYVVELHARDRWTPAQFREYQTARLAMLFAATWRSPYYRDLLGAAGVTPGMDPWEIMARVPPLDKDTLRSRGHDLLTEKQLPAGTKVLKSSGTTGTPTEIYYTPEFHALLMAIAEARNLHKGGATYRDRRVMLGVRKVCRFDQRQPPFWRYSLVENMAYCSIYHLSPQFLPHYLEFFRRYRPAVVMGYPSALCTIASYALDHDDLPAAAKILVTTSETVSVAAREAMEAAWKCRLYDRYGAVEGCLFAGQCEYGKYHVSPDVGIIEIVDEGGKPCPPGVLGEVLVTGLHNTLQPLIRYRIGDAARWSREARCACGWDTPMLEGIDGRVEDMCYTPDGRQMLRFDTVFKGVEGIREAQVVQESLRSFRVLVVPAADFSGEDVERITHNMRLHVGDIETRVEKVAECPRTPSGKFRAVICRLSPEEKESLGIKTTGR